MKKGLIRLSIVAILMLSMMNIDAASTGEQAKAVELLSGALIR